MAITITLENVPDAIYERLQESARAHHRDINSEAIACLEKTLLPTRVTREERIARARQLRSNLQAGKFDIEDISKAIEQGRS